MLPCCPVLYVVHELHVALSCLRLVHVFPLLLSLLIPASSTVNPGMQVYMNRSEETGNSGDGHDDDDKMMMTMIARVRAMMKTMALWQTGWRQR